MNHQGLRWNVHCVANVGLRKRLNLYKRGFKIYDLLVSCNLVPTVNSLLLKPHLVVQTYTLSRNEHESKA